jgi:signal transduction histidine kinase/CheY-like chemotaxis protein/HAMP domain-containing protein
MTFKDLRIDTQLKTALSIILVLVALLGALAWTQTGHLWEETRGLYEHPLTVRRAVGEIKADILTIQRDMKDLFLAQTEEDRQRLIQEMDIFEADAHQQFDIVFDRYLGPKEDVEKAFHDFIQWKAIRAETLRLFRDGRTGDAMQRSTGLGVGNSHANKVMDHVKKISDFAKARGDRFFQDATLKHRSLKAQLAFMVSFIILMTAGIGYFLYIRIRGPLKELTAATEEFRKGDLKARSRYGSANEFGILSGSFNRMAEAIASQMEIRDINEKMSDSFLGANDLPAFRENLLEKLIDITDSQMGAYFLLNRADQVYEPAFSVGLDPGLLPSFDAAAREGELGSVLTTKKLTCLKDIPDDTAFHFKTFTGTLLPKEILHFPIVIGDTVLAVASLASIRPYSEKALNILNQPWATLVNTVFANLLANDRTRQLAEELRDNNQELQVQQEELQAQAEELMKQSEELQAQNVELEQQRLTVEEASRLKSQFLSNMSHELRTPLNSVMALSRVLMMQAGTKLSDQEVNYLTIIERNGKNLLALINDILDLSKIEAGRMDVNPRPFSLVLTLENIVESLEPLAREKNIEIRREIPADLPLLESDEIRVAQILQNLTANAVKFTGQGHVTLSAAKEGGKISIRVADTGIGIAKEDLPAIFDEFRQVDGSSSRRYEGTGLGLAIARHAARMLGGDITVASTLGKGSVFTLTLPLAWQGTGDLAHTGHHETATSLTGLCAFGEEPQDDPAGRDILSANPRILLVEDNEAAIIQIRSVLERAGYRVDVTRGGQEAFEYVSHTIPDGIVLDLMMPEIDGFEVLEKVRGRSATKAIPVLILTAKDLTPEDFKRLSANHIQQLVQKGDVDQESLLLKISTMLKKGKKPDAGKVRPLIPASESPTVLIVEDNPDNMATIKAILGNRYRVLEATDGEEGLRVAAESWPDLILLDMALPKMDGFAVVRHLKESETLARIPVIALTARVMKGDRDHILAAGCDDYMAKPIDPEAFLAKIAGRLQG